MDQIVHTCLSFLLKKAETIYQTKDTPLVYVPRVML